MTDRRSFIASLAFSPMIAAPAVAIASPPRREGGISDAMSAAISRYRAASAAYDLHCSDVYGPTYERWSAEAVPHMTTRQSWVYLGEVRHMSTGNLLDVQRARAASRSKPEQLFSSEYAATCAELIDLMGWRDRQQEAILRRFNMVAIEAENDRLEDATYARLSDVEHLRAATIADLVAKIEFVREVTSRDVHGDIILEDLRAIAERGAA